MTSTASPDPADVAPILPGWSVNETLLRFPRTVAALNAFGVDACCGGASTLAQAAADADVPLDMLLDALELAAGGVR